LSAAEPDASLERRYEVLEPLILATHDLPYIAEFALRRQWPELSESDRRRFTAAFQRLSVMTYAARFSKVSSGTFKLGEGRPSASGRAEIAAAVVRPDASEVALEYLLHEREAQWKIINVIADGVSDLALKRAEYQRVLSSGSIDDLIRYVDEQTSRLQ
jgi:phospholipid transport system substrate-binding protein